MTRRIVLTEEGTALHQVVSRTLAELARESVRASFASDETRDRLLAEIDAYAAGLL
mgnify:CR=1 FL=1